MPQPRKYKTNAERQAAYRARKAAREVGPSPGVTALVQRVMAADKKAQGGQA